MINPLEKKRAEIDAIDTRLAGLLAERLTIAASLAGLKKTGRDPARETAILKRVVGLVKDGKLHPAVKTVYREIIKQGRLLQKNIIKKRKFPGNPQP